MPRCNYAVVHSYYSMHARAVTARSCHSISRQDRLEISLHHVTACSNFNSCQRATLRRMGRIGSTGCLCKSTLIGPSYCQYTSRMLVNMGLSSLQCHAGSLLNRLTRQLCQIHRPCVQPFKVRSEHSRSGFGLDSAFYSRFRVAYGTGRLLRTSVILISFFRSRMRNFYSSRLDAHGLSVSSWLLYTNNH